MRAHAPIRLYSWPEPRKRVTRTIEVMLAGRRVDGYERSEQSPHDAIDKVVAHVRELVRQGACEPGLYRFIAVGTKAVREARLTGPGRRTGL